MTRRDEREETPTVPLRPIAFVQLLNAAITYVKDAEDKIRHLSGVFSEIGRQLHTLRTRLENARDSLTATDPPK